MDQLDKIRTVMAIKNGRLPSNPRVTREDLDQLAAEGLIHAREWGWGVTVAGHDLIKGWTYDVVREPERPKPTDESGRVGANTGHGWAWERPDGMRAKCGGPAMCSDCSYDQQLVVDAREDAR